MKLRVLLLVLLSFCGLSAEESAPDADTLYRSVTIDGASYRIIVTRPKSPGHYPSVLIIGGLGCYSLDNLQPGDVYYELLYGLTRKGYVTMRVEKNGEGASQGAACDSPQSDLQLAVRRSLAGLNALATYDFVDRDKIFILAHSIGPIEGVFVAQKFQVRGFIAAETIGKTWMEYSLENARRQLLLLGRPYDVADHYVRIAEKCLHRFLIEKQTPGQVIKEMPDCKDSVATFGVAYTYLQQVAEVDPAPEWKKVVVPVLVTYGTSDPATTAADSHYLVDMINSFHPGRASYKEFPGMGHGLDLSPSPRAWLEAVQQHKHGDFDKEFLQAVADWMTGILNTKTQSAEGTM